MGVRRYYRMGLGIFGISAMLAVAGCDQSASNRPRVDPAAPRSEVRIDQNGARVDVDRADGKKPAIDVKVKPEGGVDVNVDRDKLRERIDERREERAPE